MRSTCRRTPEKSVALPPRLRPQPRSVGGGFAVLGFLAAISFRWLSVFAAELCFFAEVSAQPVSLAIKPANRQVTISWTSGLDLVQPQRATNLAAIAWQDFGAATTSTNIVDATVGVGAFYRLRFLPPTVVLPPLNQTAALGGKATFNVTATGTAPIVYQWRRSNTNLIGQTGATLELTNLALASAGDYAVVLSNRAGAATSVVATLTVGASSAIAPRGIYMGAFTGQTNGGFASLVMSNRLGVILAYSPAQIQGALVTNLVVGADGTFTNRLAQGASIGGLFASDTVSGTLISTNASTGAFSVPRKSDTGIQQSNAGYYAGIFDGLLTGNVFFILAADGTTFTYLFSPILTGGTFGKIDANNNLLATVPYTLPGTTSPSLILIAGSLNPTTHQFAGTYSFSGFTLGTFSLARVYAP